MASQYSRTELLLGTDAIKKLNKSKIIIFGLGGVGSYVVEGLARAGIGNFVLVDHDNISITNINRQIIATHSTINKPKVEIAKKRILEINPNAKVEIFKKFFMPTSEDFFDDTFDYIVDAIDTVSSKIELVERAKKFDIPIISCMGTGNKIDPTQFVVSDIYKTSVCPLAKVMRKELRKRNIEKLKVVYSKELPIKTKDNSSLEQEENCQENLRKKNIPGSVSFVPSVAGLIIAGEVVKDIIK